MFPVAKKNILNYNEGMNYGLKTKGKETGGQATDQTCEAIHQLREIHNQNCPLDSLTNSHSLLTSLIESPKNIIILALDRNYNYTAFNTNHQNEMKRLWNVDIKIGMNLLELIPGKDDRRKAKENYDKVLAGEPLSLTEEYGDPPRRFWYECY